MLDSVAEVYQLAPSPAPAHALEKLFSYSLNVIYYNLELCGFDCLTTTTVFLQLRDDAGQIRHQAVTTVRLRHVSRKVNKTKPI